MDKTREKEQQACLSQRFLAKEKHHETIKLDLKERLRDADFTLECLMHILTDVKSEHQLLQDMDETDICYIKAAIDKGLKARAAELEERHKEANKLICEILKDVLDSNSKQESIKEDPSRQHDIWTKCQKARYLLGETNEMDVAWSMVEFHADGFLGAEHKAKMSKWCWMTLPFKFYYNSIRLRVSYMCWITLLLSFSVFAGLLTETFMSTFTPLSTNGKLKFHVYLCTLPFILILFTFFSEGAVILAFDAAKSVPLIKIEATFLQGLQFFTLPRFVIFMIWSTTSAVGLQHASSLFVRTKLAWNGDSPSQIQLSVAKLCLLLILFVVEIIFIKWLQPNINFERLRHELCNELDDKLWWNKVLLFFVYCFLTLYCLIWLQNGTAFGSLVVGLFCIFFMGWLKPEEDQSWAPSRWQRQVVDITFFVLVEIMPLLSGIWGLCFWRDATDGRGPFGAFSRSYLWGGVFSATTAIATFQTCNAYIAGQIFWRSYMDQDEPQPVSSWSSSIFRSLSSFITSEDGASRTTSGKRYGAGRKSFRLGADFEIQKKMESMFHRDRVPPGMLSQIPNSIFELTVKEVEEHSICFEAYNQELFGQGVTAWKYIWYLSFAIMLAVLLLVVQVSEIPSRHHDLERLIWTGAACGILSIILCVARWCPSCLWRCLKCRCCQSVNPNRQLEVGKPVILVFLVWLVLVFGSLFVEKHRDIEAKFWIPAVCPCFLLLAAFASLAAENVMPGLVGHIYWKVAWLFALVITLVLVIPTLRLPLLGASVPIVGNNDTEYKPREAYHQYDLCKWLHGPEPLTALDVATFAGLTYETDNKNVRENLSTVFSGRAVNMTGSKKGEYPRYVVFDIGNEIKTRVIAFKGTSTTQDIYMDITLFSIIKILQGFEFIFPVIDLFPLDQIQWFLYRAHLFGQREIEDAFWKEMEHNLKRKWATSEWENRTLLTGHSLGGLIAQIMAARLNMPALVFSSPGVKYSAARFGIRDWEYWRDYTPGHDSSDREFGVQILKAKVHNVIPDHDAVPRVDDQIAMVDRIRCRDGRTNTKDEENVRPWAPACHMLTRTACELWRACGDIHKRVFNCSDYHYGPEDFSDWATPDDNA